MESTKTNTGISYGLINGIGLVVFALILYLGGVKWFMSPVAYLGYVLAIVIAVLGGVKEKKLKGGFLNFSEALKVVFMIFVIGAILSTLFNYILFNFIDVPFRQALMQEAAAKTAKLLERFGASQDKIDETTSNMINGNNYTIGKVLLGFAFSCLIWFFVSLIVSAIIKKNKPAFEN